jgi:type I restriction enzyme R subunit
MLPEEKARLIIDRKLEEAGWQIVDRNNYLPSVSAVAVKEGLMKGNKEADYLLFIKGKAVGVLEAKKEEIELDESVAIQAENYTKKLLTWCPFWQKPLPMVYLSNGKELKYKDIRNIESEYQSLQKMHTPYEVAKIAGIQDEFAGLPYLSDKGLRKCQYEAVSQLENSFSQGEKRALMVLATGAGKTFTACMAAYRLLSYTPIKRILFLVDRNNLGKQAEGEFGSFRLTETRDTFNSIFVVDRLKSPNIAEESNVVISTIQRIFAVLAGNEFEEEEREDDMPVNTDHDDNFMDSTEKCLPENPKLPSDYFDLIIVDECHRSIYGKWQQVLKYFNTAKIIGLTATPAPETLAFFSKNKIINYTLEKSIADGINVNSRVYRIKTKVSVDGGIIKEGEIYSEKTCYTNRSTFVASNYEDKYKNTELDRSVVNPEQIRMVLENFRNAIYTELFPEREPKIQYIPKTLIFAKSDAHATHIVEIAKEVFPNQSSDFVQKITYSAGSSTELIRQFRNEKSFRIAVTVNLVATGTDIKPLEILLFMRDVKSEILYTQMKGRGVRTIGDEQLRNVTPNAISKDLFYLVDAVGVTEHKMSVPNLIIREIERPINLTLAQLLEQISHGYLPDYYLYSLANRLSRINAKSTDKHRSDFITISEISMYDLATLIFNALEENTLPKFESVNELNAERKKIVAPLINNIEARNKLLELDAGFVKILIPGEDELIYRGFSQEEATSTTKAFEAYVNAHKDEIEALRIIYNNQNKAITYAMLRDLEQKLLATDIRFKQRQLWDSYSVIGKEKVVLHKTKEEREVLTNIIQLVRYAFRLISELKSLPSLSAQRFELWCGQNQRPLTGEQKEVIRQIVDYLVANGTYTNAELREENLGIFAQLVHSFGSAEIVDEMLGSLSGWMLRAG